MISVVITTYNVSKYVQLCLRSVQEQTYSNLEIIVVDDGSTDDTLTKINEIALSDNRIKVFSQINSGVSVARNYGIDNAHGDFIMFVDGDDMVEKNIVSELYSHVQPTTDVVICCCKCFNEDYSSENHFFAKDLNIASLKEKEILYLQLMNGEEGQPDKSSAFTAIGVPWGKLYRLDMLKQKHIKFDSTLRRMQDNIFNMYVFNEARVIYYLDYPLYRYRLDHISNYRHSKKRITSENYYKIISERQIFFEKYPEYMTTKIISGFNDECIKSYISSIKSICLSYKYSDARIRIIKLNSLSIYKRAFEHSFGNKSFKFNVIRFALNHGLLFVLYKLVRLIK